MSVPTEKTVDWMEEDCPTASLAQVIHRIDHLSTLPHHLFEILRITNDPLADLKDLTGLIERDPALSTRVLKTANSVASALRYPARHIRDAVRLLGFCQVRNLALSASVCQIFSRPFQVGGYSREGLWRHMVSVGIAARTLAERMHLPCPDEIFVAGLLHDLGIALEDQYDHDRFAEMLRHMTPETSLTQLEQEFLGYDHTLLGFAIAERWKLPQAVQATIALHHRHRYSGPMAQVVACVELANVMCSAKGIRSVGLPIHHLSPSVLQHLQINRHDIASLVTVVNIELDRQQELLGLIQAA